MELPKGDSAFNVIESEAGRLFGMGVPVISLGGDHAVTYPLVRAVSTFYDDLSILHFDAHPDLYDDLEGDRFSHACPFARIMEEGLVSRLLQVGIRGMNGHQRRQATRFGVEIIEMRDLDPRQVLEFKTPLYISFDIDVLDPSAAPGVSHWEPGGLTVREALHLVQKVEAPYIAGADIVEFNPRVDGSGFTAMTCAKLFKEIAAKIILTNRKGR